MSKLTVVDGDTGETLSLPWATLASVSLPDRTEEIALLGGQTLLYNEVNADSLRNVQNSQWVFTFPDVDQQTLGYNTRELVSALRSWKMRGTTLTLSGPDLFNLNKEILTRVTTGTNANKRFIAAQGWWSSGELVEQLTSGSWGTVTPTVDSDSGWVTFASAVAANDFVRVTVARSPQVQVMHLEPNPQNSFDPVRYMPTVVFREMTP